MVGETCFNRRGDTSVMNEDGRRWLDGLGARMLLEVGLRSGDRVLDFGCGTGMYVLPAAMLVGPDGLVYALDRDGGKLDVLRERLDVYNVGNVEVVETAGSLALSFPDGSLDAVLVYDVLHSDFFTGDRRRELLREIARVLTRDGLLSVFLRHMDDDVAVQAARDVGFRLSRRITTDLHHYDHIVHDTVMNFRKEA